MTAQPETQGRPTPAQRLEAARTRLRAVSRHVTSTEGRLLDYETADEIQRALHTTLREMEELTLQLAVRERRSGEIEREK